MSIKVLKPGLATSVQDAGREGHYHLGIPPSGALDQYALRAANLLVGNAPTAAVLECALLGPQLEFLGATLNAKSVASWFGAGFVLVTGVGLFELCRRQFMRQWGAIQEEIEHEIKRGEAG